MSSSDTARTGMEQLLISNAVDQSLNKIDFRPLAGQIVHVEEKYLECTDKNYILASLRHRLMYAGAEIAAKPEDATVILEARAGSVGTDRAKTFIGMPEIAIPGPMPIAFPEIRIVERGRHTGTAKIGIVAYDAKTKEPLGPGGLSLAKSDDNNWYVLGMGPFQNGSVRSEVTTSLSRGSQKNTLPVEVALRPPSNGQFNESRVKLTGGNEQPATESKAAVQQISSEPPWTP